MVWPRVQNFQTGLFSNLFHYNGFWKMMKCKNCVLWVNLVFVLCWLDKINYQKNKSLNKFFTLCGLS